MKKKEFAKQLVINHFSAYINDMDGIEKIYEKAEKMTDSMNLEYIEYGDI